MSDDVHWMRRALQLARSGQGCVEPNPMVGCLVVQHNRVIGEGYHEQFGGPHAEVNALQSCRESTVGSTIYVTLEPCCHDGKTPPCTDAVLRAAPGRVVIAMRDPFPQVDGGGVLRLKQQGIDVEVGCLERESRQLNQPYLKLVQRQRPWIIAKWAMTLDGKIATSTGSSRWISSEPARALVHQLRGRVDGIAVGSGTALADNPRLDARPAGLRVATRIAMDTRARLPLTSLLVETAREIPVLVFVGDQADGTRVKKLIDRGCEVFVCDGADAEVRLGQALDELGRRRMTNLLVEGGGSLLGSLFDLDQIDEVHAFCAPRIVGGSGPSPLAGTGLGQMAHARNVQQPQTEMVGDDIYISGRLHDLL